MRLLSLIDSKDETLTAFVVKFMLLSLQFLHGFTALMVVFIPSAVIVNTQGSYVLSCLILVIGDASYSLYLCHIFVLISIALCWKALSLQKVLPTEALYVSGGVVAVCIGIVLYRFFEKSLTDWLNNYFTAHVLGEKSRLERKLQWSIEKP
jgi:peptidoglycan/LPS O-acetylase OafA/YrhL